ncbi:MAG: hypothetical protein M3454_09070 [Actinomycetota bacterium]|nr:hypothetical protein [Actinomycetota bacterium]
MRNEVWNRYLELMRSNDEKVALRATTWFLDKVLSVPPMLGKFSLEDVDLDQYSAFPAGASDGNRNRRARQ